MQLPPDKAAGMYQSKAGGLATGRATLQAQHGQGCSLRPQASGKQRTPKGDRGKVKGPQSTEMCPASKVLGQRGRKGVLEPSRLRKLGSHTLAMPTPSPPEGALSALTGPLAGHTFSKSSSGHLMSPQITNGGGGVGGAAEPREGLPASVPSRPLDIKASTSLMCGSPRGIGFLAWGSEGRPVNKPGEGQPQWLPDLPGQ